MSMKIRRTRKRLEEEARHKHDESKNNLHEGSFDRRVGKLARQDLDSILQVDPGDEKAETSDTRGCPKASGRLDVTQVLRSAAPIRLRGL